MDANSKLKHLQLEAEKVHSIQWMMCETERAEEAREVEVDGKTDID
jgi:hypothetical protein